MFFFVISIYDIHYVQCYTAIDCVVRCMEGIHRSLNYYIYHFKSHTTLFQLVFFWQSYVFKKTLLPSMGQGDRG